MLLVLVVGAIAGFVTAIPVAGPISALVFSQGMRGRIAQGRGIALGAGLAEGVYAFLAYWGFSRLGPRFPRLFLVSNLFAAVVLAALGVYFYRSKKLRHPAPSSRAGTARVVKSIVIGAGISAMNLSLVATWAALIGTLYAMQALEFSTANAAFFSIGVAGGIFAWFTVFLELIRRYRARLEHGILDRFLKIFGVLLVAVSIGMAARLARHGS